MKTANGMEYEFLPPTARPVDLGERLSPALAKWIGEGNIEKGDGGVTVLILMDNPLESTHRLRVSEAQALKFAAQSKEEQQEKGGFKTEVQPFLGWGID